MAGYLKIQKRYGSTYDYKVDMAKSTGVYNSALASDSDTGLAYIDTLASLQIQKTSENSTEEEKLEAQKKIDTISNLDLSLLNPMDSLSKIQLSIGDLSEDEFKSYFTGDGSKFEDMFDSIDDYFEYQQERTYDKAVFDNMSGVRKALNGMGYFILETLQTPVEMLEGIIDAGATIAAEVGGSEKIATFVAKDLSGQKGLDTYRRTRVSWDDRKGFARFMGNLATELGKFGVTAALNAIPVAGQIGTVVYLTSMAGQTGQDVYNRYGTSMDTTTRLKRNGDLAATLAIEAVTELIFAGGPNIKAGKFNLWQTSTTTGRLVRGGIEEGVEELIAEMVQPLVQNAIQNGDLSKLDAGEYFKNIGTAALIGSVIGVLGQGVQIATVKPGQIGIFKDGVKVSKAKALAIIEEVQRNKKSLAGVVDSKVSEFLDSNNLTKTDQEQIDDQIKNGVSGDITINSVDTNGNTYERVISEKELNKYQKAKQVDSDNNAKVSAMLLNLSELYTAVGAENFEAGLNLWDTTEANRLEVAKNWYEFLGEVDSGAYSENVLAATTTYAEINASRGIGVQPIHTSRLTKKHIKFMDVVKKLTGGIVTFVNHFNSETITPVTNLEESQIVESYTDSTGQEYLFVDASKFDVDTSANMLIKIAKVTAAKLAVANNTIASRLKDNELFKNNIITKTQRRKSTDNLREYNQKQDKYQQIEAVVNILTDPDVASRVFSTDKKLCRELVKLLKLKTYGSKTSVPMAVAYRRLLWTLRKNICSKYPKKAKALILKQLDTGVTQDDFKLIITHDELQSIERYNEMLDNADTSEDKLKTLDLFLKDSFTEEGVKLTKTGENTKDKKERFENKDKWINKFKTQFKKRVMDIATTYEIAIAAKTDAELNRQNILANLALISQEAQYTVGKLQRGEISQQEADTIISKYNDLKKSLEEITQEIKDLNDKISSLEDDITSVVNEANDYLQEQVEKQHRTIDLTNKRIVKELVLHESTDTNEQKDAEVAFSSMIETDSPNQAVDGYWFHWGLVTEDCSASESSVSDTKKHLATNMKLGLQIPNFVDPNSYNDSFVQKLYEQYEGAASFAEMISEYCYDNFGTIVLADGEFVIPIEYTQYMDSNQVVDFLDKSQTTTADKFFNEEFFKKYPKLKEILRNTKVSVENDPQSDDAGWYTKSGGVVLNSAHNYRSKTNTLLHEITHAILDNLGLYYSSIYKENTYSEKEMVEIENILFNNGLLSNKTDKSAIAWSVANKPDIDSYKTSVDDDPVIRMTDAIYKIELWKNIKSALWKLDLNEFLARGEDTRQVNKLSKLGTIKSTDPDSFKRTWTFDNTESIILTSDGLQGTGNLSKILIPLSTITQLNLRDRRKTKLSDRGESSELSLGEKESAKSLRLKADSKELEITSETVKNQIQTQSSELSKNNMGFLVSQNISNIDAKVSNKLIESTDTASDESKDMMVNLKKELPKSNNLITALDNSDKFSETFVDVFKSVAGTNTVAVSTPVRVREDLRDGYASVIFNNEDALKNLSDTEIKFLLDNCFNCKSLKIETAEDLSYWIKTGFPVMAGLAMSKKSSETVKWEDLKTISDVKNFVETNYKKVTKTSDYKNNKDYKSLEDKKYFYEKLNNKIGEKGWLKTLTDDEINLLGSQNLDQYRYNRSEIKKLNASDPDVQILKNSNKKIKQNWKNMLISKINDVENDMLVFVVNYNSEDIKTASDIASSSIDIEDLLTNVKSSRNVFAQILGNSKTEVKLEPSSLKAIANSLKTSASFIKSSGVITTKDGDELNALENIADSDSSKNFENINNEVGEKSVGQLDEMFITKTNGIYSDKSKLIDDINKVISNDSIPSSKSDTSVNNELTTGDVIYNLDDPITNLFLYGITLLADNGHVNKNTMVSQIVNWFSSVLPKDNKVNISKFVNIMMRGLNFDNNIFKSRQANWKAFVDIRIQNDHIRDNNNKYESKLKKYSKTVDLKSPELKPFIDSDGNLKHYDYTNPKATEQILTLEYLEFKSKLIDKLSKDYAKKDVEEAINSIKSKNSAKNKKKFEEQVRALLGENVTAKKDAVVKESTTKRKASVKKTTEKTKIEAAISTVTNNAQTVESITPEAVVIADKVNAGEKITEQESNILNQAAEEQKATEKVSNIKITKSVVPKEVKDLVAVKLKRWIRTDDGNLKPGLLTSHEYNGTVLEFKGSKIYTVDIDSNGGVIKQILNELNDIYATSSGDTFIAFLWELQKQLKEMTYVKSTPDGKTHKSVLDSQNKFIGDSIWHWIFSNSAIFTTIVSVANVIHHNLAREILEVGAVEAMINGSSLRTGLQISKNQFNVDEKSLETLKKTFSVVDPVAFATELNALISRISKLEKEMAEREAQHYKNTNDLDKKRKELDDLQKQRSEYQQKLNELREQLVKASSGKMVNVSEQTERQKEIDNLQKTIEELNKQVSTQNKELKSLEETVRKEKEALSKEAIEHKKVIQLLNGLRSKNPEIRNRALAAVHQYADQYPKEVSEAIKQAKIKELLKDAMEKHGKSLGLVPTGKVVFDRIRRFRYLAMLSSPSTWQRNYNVNLLMKGVEAFTEILADSKFINSFKSIKKTIADFEKLNVDETKQTVTYTDDDGVEHSYKLPVQMYDWHRVTLDDYVYQWIKDDIFPQEELDKVFGFGGKYGEFEKHKKDNLLDDITPENKFDKFMNFFGNKIEWILSKTDAKFTHPMVKRVFGQLVISNMKQLTEAILTKQALQMGLDVKSEQFKNSSEYKHIVNLVDIIVNKKENVEKAFQEFTQLLPKEFIEKFKTIAINYTKKTYFKNDNAIGKWLRELQESSPLWAIPIEILTPFARMSVNIAMTVFDYSPAGFIKLWSSRHTYKKLVNEIAEYTKMSTEEFDTNITKTKNELLDMYNKMTNQKVDINAIVQAVTNDLNQTEESSKKRQEGEYVEPKLSVQQYVALKSKLDDLNAYVGSQQQVQKEISNRVNQLSGFEIVDMKRQAAKAVIGTCSFIAGAILMALGVLDYDEEDYLGVVLKVGGFKVRLSDLSPVTSSMAHGAIIFKTILSILNPDYKGLESPLATLLTTILNDTPIDFISDAIEYSDNVAEWGANIISNLTLQFIPNIIKQFGRLVGQNKKVKSSKSIARIGQNIADSLPILRLTLSDKIDPYTGDAIRRTDLGVFGTGILEMLYLTTGVRTVYRNTNSIEQEVKRLEVESSGATGRFSYKGDSYVLDNKKGDLNEFKQYRGQYIKDKFNKLVETSAYKNASDDVKKQLIKELYAKASEYAKNSWIKNNKKDLKIYIKKA